MLERVVQGAARVLNILVGGLLGVVVVITLAQVAARYLLGSSLIWSEELNRLLYIWIILLATVQAAHMRIGLFVDRAGPGAQKWAHAVSGLIQVALVGLIVYGAWKMYLLSEVDHFIGLHLSVKWIYVAPLLGGGLLLLVVIGRHWKMLRAGEEDET